MNAAPNATLITQKQPRRVERRAGLDLLLRQVAADLIHATDRRNLTVCLTQRLAQLSHARTVGLKEVSRSLPSRSPQPVRAIDYVAVVVPVKEEGRQVMLEASFDARTGPDDWTCQLLEAAAPIAGMLLETERLANTPAPLTVAERDGAAPLIGSSETMRLLRDRVERVANTNFTVLIEGESGVG
ncbi:MAG: hypothetical protein ABI024_00125, partial [Vicinamibacterales bacterium]